MFLCHPLDAVKSLHGFVKNLDAKSGSNFLPRPDFPQIPFLTDFSRFNETKSP
jgi:hypothetical protein